MRTNAFNLYPVMGAAYRAKESFFDIYNASTVHEAQSLFGKWEVNLAPEIKESFYPLTRAINNWMPEILNYFSHPVTNAYTESLNNLIRVMNRLGRGYSFEALRAKVLFTEGVQKKGRPKFEKRKGHVLPEGAFGFMLAESSTRYDSEEDNYGADISTLVRLIEEGNL